MNRVKHTSPLMEGRGTGRLKDRSGTLVPPLNLGAATVAPKSGKMVLQAIPLNRSFKLSNEDYSVVARFRPPCGSGLYMCSLQLAIEHKGPGSSVLDYVQFGVCRDEDFSENFNSKTIGTTVEKDYIICESFTFLQEYDGDDDVVVWMNIRSDDNRRFEYSRNRSKLVVVRM